MRITLIIATMMILAVIMIGPVSAFPTKEEIMNQYLGYFRNQPQQVCPQCPVCQPIQVNPVPTCPTCPEVQACPEITVQPSQTQQVCPECPVCPACPEPSVVVINNTTPCKEDTEPEQMIEGSPVSQETYRVMILDGINETTIRKALILTSGYFQYYIVPANQSKVRLYPYNLTYGDVHYKGQIWMPNNGEENIIVISRLINTEENEITGFNGGYSSIGVAVKEGDAPGSLSLRIQHELLHKYDQDLGGYCHTGTGCQVENDTGFLEWENMNNLASSYQIPHMALDHIYQDYLISKLMG